MKQLILLLALYLSTAAFAQTQEQGVRISLTSPQGISSISIRSNGYLLVFDRDEFLGCEKNNADLLALFPEGETLELDSLKRTSYDASMYSLRKFITERINQELEDGHAMVMTTEHRNLNVLLMQYRNRRGFGCHSSKHQRFLNPSNGEPIFVFTYWKHIQGCPNF